MNKHISRKSCPCNGAATQARAQAGSRPRRPAIHAELVGSNYCCALGLTAHSTAPVLALCCLLLAEGINPETPLHAYRGATLALTVRSIGEGAGLEINGHGSGFIRRSKGGAAALAGFSRLVGRSTGGRACGAPGRAASGRGGP